MVLPLAFTAMKVLIFGHHIAISFRGILRSNWLSSVSWYSVPLCRTFFAVFILVLLFLFYLQLFVYGIFIIAEIIIFMPFFTFAMVCFFSDLLLL